MSDNPIEEEIPVRKQPKPRLIEVKVLQRRGDAAIVLNDNKCLIIDSSFIQDTPPDSHAQLAAVNPVVKKRPSDRWPRASYDPSMHWDELNRTFKDAISSNYVDHTAIVMNANFRSTLEKAKAEFNSDGGTGFFTVKYDTGTWKEGGGSDWKNVRIMGSFSDPNNIPKVGDRILVAKDNGSGRYKPYWADVVKDLGTSLPLWHYD